MDIINVITKEQNLRREQAQAVIRLIDEGNTIPFIARYRKEQHGNMSDEQLRAFDERLRYLRALDERRKTILSAIEAQGKLTPELRKEIGEAMTATALEDLYRPLRPKRRTRAMIAKEKGLQPLADYLLLEKTELYPQQEAQRYVNKEAGIPDADTALHMAMDILSEMLSDDAKERAWIREKTLREGRLVTEKTGKSGKAAQQNEKLAQREAVYEMYYEYSEPFSRIPGHRILAVNRGEKEKFLSVRIEALQEEIVQHLYRRLNLRKTASGDVFRENEKTAPYLQAVAADAYKRLIAPSIETELRGVLTQKAEDGAMTVFASNLRQLLMQAPVEGKVVLGWDPAFRTGCKLA
ncbi:MAG TPA: RNA-binding transcriptional accessory protein, partial [Lachnospiraceae bacterium]|nr:RNA-binding transcriptional accessory protein [Lachnospiraceae bacterium]